VSEGSERGSETTVDPESSDRDGKPRKRKWHKKSKHTGWKGKKKKKKKEKKRKKDKKASMKDESRSERAVNDSESSSCSFGSAPANDYWDRVQLREERTDGSVMACPSVRHLDINAHLRDRDMSA
jgi:hypothetical protein